MVVGELTEVSAIVATQVPQCSRPTRKNTLDVTHPTTDGSGVPRKYGAIVNAYCGAHPYHGTADGFEINGWDEARICRNDRRGGAVEELRRKIDGRDTRTQGVARVARAGAIQVGLPEAFVVLVSPHDFAPELLAALAAADHRQRPSLP